jgi:hypothetical protein
MLQIHNELNKGMNMADDGLAVKLAQLQEQMSSVASNIEEIKATVSQIRALDRTIAEMAVRGEHAQSEILTLWSKIEEMRTWTVDHEQKLVKSENEARETVKAVDGKIEAMINRGKGVMWLGGIVFTVVQGVIAFSVLWTFEHVQKDSDLNLIQEYRLTQLERGGVSHR